MHVGQLLDPPPGRRKALGLVVLAVDQQALVERSDDLERVAVGSARSSPVLLVTTYRADMLASRLTPGGSR